MDDAIRSAVAVRAGYRCEYCRLHQEDDVHSFHIEHIVAIKHGGSDDFSNLAFACQHCNLHKGPNLSGIDHITGVIVELFHPRRDVWTDHLAIDEFRFVSLTPTGRATIRVLEMNDSDRVRIRSILDFGREYRSIAA